jgi:hypothetical protein
MRYFKCAATEVNDLVAPNAKWLELLESVLLIFNIGNKE